MKDLEIKTADHAKITEILHTWKKWFNGPHRFWTVKLSPPKKD